MNSKIHFEIPDDNEEIDRSMAHIIDHLFNTLAPHT